MNAVVTGATGFIGAPLCRRLIADGHTVTSLTRDAVRAQTALGAGVRYLAWDDTTAWRPVVRDADVVFHLAGEPVAGARWTTAYKEKILQSRIETTRAIADAHPRGVLVSASAVGFYGDRGTSVVTEADPSGDDFLARVCVQWEAEAEKAERTASRVARVRIGIVLGNGGGPLASMLPPFRLGLGGPIGNGKQFVPWVHLADVIGLLLLAATNENARGAINASAPDPVTSADLAAAIGRALGKPAVVPVPALALRAVVGEMAYALLYSQRVSPQTAQSLGYAFRFANVDAALRDLLGA